jgi:Na+/H+ antiporter NhaD/arsenite permease-like protein
MVIPVMLVIPIVKKIPISGVVSDETVADVGGGHGHAVYEVSKGRRNTIFITGLISLIMVPVIKTITHLPPFIAILMNLGVLWLVTELIHRGEEKHIKDPLTVVNVIRRIDTPSVLFFAGILLAVACLQSTGILGHLAQYLDKAIGNLTVISFTLGLLSAIVDNVPLVAAAMGMYTLEAHPVDSQLWQLIAYCAGTGGSCLIIGSAAGVAAMGMERIEFIWYAKKIAWIAFLGYLGGMLFFIFVF